MYCYNCCEQCRFALTVSAPRGYHPQKLDTPHASSPWKSIVSVCSLLALSSLEYRADPQARKVYELLTLRSTLPGQYWLQLSACLSLAQTRDIIMAWVFAVGPILRKLCRIAGLLTSRSRNARILCKESPKRAKYQKHAWSPKTAELSHAEIRPIGSLAQSQSGFDFSAFCKAGRGPRPAFSTGSNFEQAQRQANYATACSLEISPADPTLHVAHCLRNKHPTRSFYGC